MDIVLTGVSVLILLLMAGFFSLAQAALSRVSHVRITELCNENDSRAIAVKYLLSKETKLNDALLLGRVLANVFATALMTGLMLQLFGQSGVLIAVGLMAILILVITEALPKSYALKQSDKIALCIAPYVRIIYAMLWLPTFLVSSVTDRFGLLLDNKTETAESFSDTSLSVQTYEATVAKVMISRDRIDMLDASMPVTELVNKVLESPYSRIPLYQDQSDTIVGILQTPLLLKQLRSTNGDDATIDFSAAVSEPWFIRDTTPLRNQLQAFRERQEQFALVVDEFGALLGFVTREDILEEIVGATSIR